MNRRRFLITAIATTAAATPVVETEDWHGLASRLAEIHAKGIRNEPGRVHSGTAPWKGRTLAYGDSQSLARFQHWCKGRRVLAVASSSDRAAWTAFVA